jgi:hypothetical protein
VFKEKLFGKEDSKFLGKFLVKKKMDDFRNFLKIEVKKILDLLRKIQIKGELRLEIHSFLFRIEIFPYDDSSKDITYILLSKERIASSYFKFEKNLQNFAKKDEESREFVEIFLDFCIKVVSQILGKENYH